MNDSIALRGEVITELIDARTGLTKVTRTWNLITTLGLNNVAQLIGSVGAAAPSHIAIGTGAATEYAETNQDQDKDLTSTGADQRLAQGFQIAAAATIPRSLLWLKRIGTSAGTLQVRIETDSGGDPSGTIVTNGASNTISINGLGTTYDWATFEFATAPSLAASTQYHLVLRATSYTYSSGVTEVNWGVDESAPAYANGALRSYNGTVWSAASPAADGVFRVNANPVVGSTALTDEVARAAITSSTILGSSTSRMLALFGVGTAIDRHGEVGLFNDATTGTLIAAAAINIKKTSAQRLNVYWQIAVS